MKTGCRRAGILLARRNAGLADADALRLEEHLSDCARCREQARILDSLLLADAEGRPPRPSGAAARALRRALDQAEARRPRPVRHRASPALRLGLAAGGAAAVAAALVALSLRNGSSGGAAGTPSLAAPSEIARSADAAVRTPPSLDRVEAGMVTSDGVSLADGDRVASRRPLIVEREARLALAHARVNASTGSALEWNAGERTLRVHSGSVRVAVDPAPRRFVRVVTDRFAVEVLGTEFAVDPGGVEVTSGTVRIVGAAGEILVESLAAGQAWRMDVDVDQGRERDGRPADAERAGREDARQILARARTLVAAGDAAGARRAARSALARNPEPADAAEARTLMAECALLEGNRELAIELYLEVAERHRRLPAGETALFLAGRVADDGRHRRAPALLRRYLAAYPSGRFHVEARRRMANHGQQE